MEEVIRKVLGPSVVIRLESGHGGFGASTAAEPAVKPAGTRNLSRARPACRSELAQIPLVKKAMDLFGAQVVQLPDEDFGALPRPGPSPARGKWRCCGTDWR